FLLPRGYRGLAARALDPGALPGNPSQGGIRVTERRNTMGSTSVRGLRRALLAAAAAAFVLGVVASGSAGAPSFGSWSTPVNLGTVVNSAVSETGPALSPDGLSLYFNRPVGTASDIFVSQRATLASPWGAPANLGSPINTASADFVTSFTPDGHWM